MTIKFPDLLAFFFTVVEFRLRIALAANNRNSSIDEHAANLSRMSRMPRGFKVKNSVIYDRVSVAILV